MRGGGGWVPNFSRERLQSSNRQSRIPRKHLHFNDIGRRMKKHENAVGELKFRAVAADELERRTADRAARTRMPEELARPSENVLRPEGTQDAKATLDVAATLSRLDGDQILFHELIEIYLVESKSLLAELVAAVRNHDAIRVEHSAHKLKGSASLFGAAAVVASAQALETMAHEGRLGGAEQELGLLQQHLTALEESLCALKA